MKQSLIIVIIVCALLCLLISTLVSVDRAKHLPEQQEDTTVDTTDIPAEQPMPGITYFKYTGQVHPGTGIAYEGNGENAAKVIVIDAGHQMHAMNQTEPNGPGSKTEKAKVTGGTQGSLTGLAEYELNLRVALALRDVLVSRGYCVVMVRETNEVEISNAQRAQLANLAGAHANIRIHANGDADVLLKGAMAICQTPNNPYNADIYQECRLLSETVLQAFCHGTGMSQRNVWETDTMTGTNWAKVPTTIIEMGFMTNAEDETAMAKEGFADRAAEAIAAGIEEYFAKTDSEQTTAPDRDYDINYDVEAELGQTFTEVYMTMRTTGNVRARTEPSTRGGEMTTVLYMSPGQSVICIGLGQEWNRVLIDGKVCYMSAAHMEAVSE